MANEINFFFLLFIQQQDRHEVAVVVIYLSVKAIDCLWTEGPRGRHQATPIPGNENGVCYASFIELKKTNANSNRVVVDF